MNAGSLVGIGTVVGIGLITYGLIKRKCKKEVKVYNEIKYPKEEDRRDRVGTTEPGIDPTKSESINGITKDKCSGEYEERGTLQDKSFEHDERYDSGDEEPDKANESDSSAIESIEPIDLIPVEPIEE